MYIETPPKKKKQSKGLAVIVAVNKDIVWLTFEKLPYFPRLWDLEPDEKIKDVNDSRKNDIFDWLKQQ